MNVKQLIIELEKYPDNMQVFIAERKTEFQFGLLNSVKSKMINFKEDPDDSKVLARERSVILDEE